MPQIYFIYHSCYLLVSNKSLMLFDYFEADGTEGVKQRAYVQALLEKHARLPLYIFCSHSHADHYSPLVHMLFAEHRGGAHYIFHEEVRSSVPEAYRPAVHFLATGESMQIGLLQIKAYGSTDLGGSFYVEEEGCRIFHAGDLNNWHWNEEADPEYIAQYEEQWHQELARLTADHLELDLLMFPTDLRLGRDYLKGLRELLGQIPVGTLAPMHLNGIMHSWAELLALCQEYHVTLYDIEARG